MDLNPEGLATRMNPPGGSDQLPGLLGKEKSILIRSGK
jgi:hypothetical protein